MYILVRCELRNQKKNKVHSPTASSGAAQPVKTNLRKLIICIHIQGGTQVPGSVKFLKKPL